MVSQAPKKSGETPHKRFVFAKGDSILLVDKEDRGGKLQGQLGGPGLIVVPVKATGVVFAAKKRLHEQRRNRIFSVVGAARTLDLEADSEAERHQWVRALTAFVKRADGAAADPLVSAAAATGLLGATMEDASALGIGAGAALGAKVDDKIEEGQEGAHAHLARHDTADMSAALSFPRLRATLKVLTGDLVGRWQPWDLELEDGELSSAGRGCLPLRHVAALGVSYDDTADATNPFSSVRAGSRDTDASDISDGLSEMSMSERSASLNSLNEPEGELRLRLKAGKDVSGDKAQTNAGCFLSPAAAAAAKDAKDAKDAPPDLRMRAAYLRRQAMARCAQPLDGFGGGRRALTLCASRPFSNFAHTDPYATTDPQLPLKKRGAGNGAQSIV